MGKVCDQIDQWQSILLAICGRCQEICNCQMCQAKSDAAQAVINYLAHLKTQGRNPKGIQIDNGKEFINEKLESWCQECSMEICYTVLYSPSQNGIAKRMNRTLVELS